MRLTLSLLGLELDVTFGIAGGDEVADEDNGVALNGGTTYATGMTFTGDAEIPEEVPVPMRCNGWPDEDKRVGFRRPHLGGD